MAPQIRDVRKASDCRSLAMLPRSCFLTTTCFVLVLISGVESVALSGARLRGPSISSFGPPHDYRYDKFMEWHRKHGNNEELLDKYKWFPDEEEFDIDRAARNSKFAASLREPPTQDTDRAIVALKAVNKWEFMTEMMESGDETKISGPGSHLYILKQLLPAAVGSKHPTFYDAGCGPGVLLLAWVLATGRGSKAIGMDADTETIVAALRHIRSTNVVDRTLMESPSDSAIQPLVGKDALRPDLHALGISNGTVDAINVGFSCYEEELEELTKLLRPGGLMLAPICEPKAMSTASPKDRCNGMMRVFRKEIGQDGRALLIRKPGDSDVPVKFIVGTHSRDEADSEHRSR